MPSDTIGVVYSYVDVWKTTPRHVSRYVFKRTYLDLHEVDISTGNTHLKASHYSHNLYLYYLCPMVQKRFPWWRHQMETFSVLLALCAGNLPVTDEFPAKRPVTQSFDIFFDLRLNKWWSKQSLGWWFETPSRSLWRHCNIVVILARYMQVGASFVTKWNLKSEFS